MKHCVFKNENQEFLKRCKLGTLHRSGWIVLDGQACLLPKDKRLLTQNMNFYKFPFKEDVMQVLRERKTKKGPQLRALQHIGVYDSRRSLSYFFLCVISLRFKKMNKGLPWLRKALKQKRKQTFGVLSQSLPSFIMLCVGLFTVCQSVANTIFYADKQRGYFWFEGRSPSDLSVSELNQPTEDARPKEKSEWSDSKYKTARDALKAFQDELEEKKAHFVLKPTVDSALSYLKIQKAMLNQTSKVAHVYKKALMMTQKEHATSSYVVGRLKDNERRLENEKKLTLSSRFFDILFVYKKGCPYCEKFKDILLRFQKTFGYHVDALSIGGGHYKDFHTIRTHPLEKLTSFEMVPAVFLVSKTKDIAAPISQGYLPYDSLKERIVFILDEMEKES